jgi:E3 ubiquitin-protein ligase UBR4
MSYLQNVSKAKPFLQTLLKLFLMCVKVKKCREELCQPELSAISTLLKVLHLCLQHQVQENDPQMSTVTEQLLEIMETILAKAASDSLDSFLQFSLTFGGPEYIEALLSCTNHANVRNNPHVLRCLIRVVAALVYGNDIKMALLCDHFKNSFNFEKFDAERTAEEEFQLELFCILCSAIERNSIGGILKDYITGLGIVDKAVNYIVKNSPQNRIILLPFASSLDFEELKIFISKPSLKYILQFLSGLANKHEKTQLAVAKDLIPIIHQLEQVSSDEHVGSLAENLLEALSLEPATAKIVQEYRDSTKAEKKRLAMATREKQLNAMGMKTNEKGQVTAKEQVLQELDSAMADLVKQETGLTCFICREGYASQPNQVMGIYTFTKRCPLEDFEISSKGRKTMGYTTVTHFNIVHTNCHMSAIRSSRGRDEWESASLQNTNTKCNGLLPLWGPDVSETAFSACMARQHSYLQDSTQRIEITFTSGIHDLKLLLLRFAHEKTFHIDCGGGKCLKHD